MKKGAAHGFVSDAHWLKLIEELILKHSSREVIVRGKNKGHRMTDTVGWVEELTYICHKYLRRRNKGRDYDGNMALAALLGRVLVLWYCNVHRAKGFDPNRPLLNRKQVFTQLSRYRGRLVAGMSDDRLMGAVWGKQQQWNFPFGKGAKGGKFV